MIEGIGIALKTYYDTATEAKQVLETAMKEIGENYIGAKYAELVGQAKDAFNTTMDECRTENYNACIAVLDEVSASAKKVVEIPFFRKYAFAILFKFFIYIIPFLIEPNHACA